MHYSLITFWHERQRFLPAVLAVAFSALLIDLQGGLLVGLLELMSTPVDHAAADVWVGHPKVRSVDLGQPIPAEWRARLARQPEVTRVDPCVLGFAYWVRSSSFSSRTRPSESRSRRAPMTRHASAPRSAGRTQ